MPNWTEEDLRQHEIAPQPIRVNKILRNKFNAHKTVVDGITFDSKKEAVRYAELKIQEKIGWITKLSLQPKFLLQGSFFANNQDHKAIYYQADFQYWDSAGQWIVEDCKGYRTPVYRLKKKLFLFLNQDVIFIES